MKHLLLMTSVLTLIWSGLLHADHQDFNRFPDLCSGPYWGQWSNGVGVTMRFTRRGRNQVDIFIENQGGYTFVGYGQCNQRGYDAYVDFRMEGYGAVSYNHGEIHLRGGTAYLTGQQERSGLYFSLER